MADAVGEGATARRTRTLRAGLAPEALAAAPSAPDRSRLVLEQVLVLTRAAFAGVYVRGATGEVLCLSESVGVPRTLYGVGDGHRLAGADPAHLGPAAGALLGDARRNDDVALLLMRYDGTAVRPLRESRTVWRLSEAVRHTRRSTRRTCAPGA